MRWPDYTCEPTTSRAKIRASLLVPYEFEKLGDLDGKRVCHLQCHFGGDSMVLARHGADVVGLDFSPEAVAVTRPRPASRSDFASCSHRIDRALENLEGPFDVVYTSWVY